MDESAQAAYAFTVLPWSANHQAVTGDALARIGDGGYWHGARARPHRPQGLEAADRRLVGAP